MSLTAKFAEHLSEMAGAPLDDLDAEVTKSLFLDHLGVTAKGSATATAAVVRDYLCVVGGLENRSFPLIGTEHAASPLHGAFANSVAGHSVELDDCHNASSTHPGVVVFPAAMAAALLAEPISDDRFLVACAIGYESMCRVGRAISPADHYACHFHPTATAGRFGAVAAAGVILGLSPSELTAAFGIAATSSAGSLEFLADGAWTKSLHPGQAVRDGIEASMLAKLGYRGTKDGLGGARGFLAAYTSNPQPAELLADWGNRPLEVRATSSKPYACCRYMQGPIDALLEIRETRKLSGAKVHAVRIGIPTVAVEIIWEPTAHKLHPVSMIDAQFSMPYGAAIALDRGRASLSDFDPAEFEDPELHRLMEATECVVDPLLDRAYPEKWKAWAEVDTVDGRTYGIEIEDPKGDPSNPMTEEELLAKFTSLTAPVFSPSRQEQVIRAVASLGTGTDLTQFCRLLQTDLV